MVLTYHKNCKEKFPHKPEVTIEILDFDEAFKILKKEKKGTVGYIDWDKDTRSLIVDGKFQKKNGKDIIE